jgi:hypothetical protein
MSMKRFLTLTALTTVACLSLGDRAHATYTITPTIVSPAVNPANLTFSVLPLTNSPIPTPSLGTQYSWMTVAVANTPTLNVTNETVNYDVKFNVVDNATLATSSFEIFGTLVLNLTSGTGSLQNTFSAPIPTGFLLGAIPFTVTPPPLAYSGPTLNNGSADTARFSLILNAVPEPASVVMMGLGVVMAGSLGYVHRRRMLAQQGA